MEFGMQHRIVPSRYGTYLLSRIVLVSSLRKSQLRFHYTGDIWKVLHISNIIVGSIGIGNDGFISLQQIKNIFPKMFLNL